MSTIPWTFAGGRINATLRYALEAVGGDWKVVPDNYVVNVRGADLDPQAVFDAVSHLRDPAFWDDDALWDEVAATLPSYRLSKFQPLMPMWVQREMVGAYLLDVGGAQRWAASGGGSNPRSAVR